MLIMSFRFSSKCSFSGQAAKCEVQTLNKESNTKRTFTGATLKEALDKIKKDNQPRAFMKIS